MLMDHCTVFGVLELQEHTEREKRVATGQFVKFFRVDLCCICILLYSKLILESWKYYKNIIFSSKLYYISLKLLHCIHFVC